MSHSSARKYIGEEGIERAGYLSHAVGFEISLRG